MTERAPISWITASARVQDNRDKPNRKAPSRRLGPLATVASRRWRMGGVGVVGGRGCRGLGPLVAEEGESALGTPVREVAVLAALQGERERGRVSLVHPGLLLLLGGHRFV